MVAYHIRSTVVCLYHSWALALLSVMLLIAL